MGERIIFLLRVHNLRKRLVGHKLGSGEGNRHAQGGRVRDVEGADSFGAVDSPSALGNSPVSRAMDLHPLLDNCNPQKITVNTHTRISKWNRGR